MRPTLLAAAALAAAPALRAADPDADARAALALARARAAAAVPAVLPPPRPAAAPPTDNQRWNGLMARAAKGETVAFAVGRASPRAAGAPFPAGFQGFAAGEYEMYPGPDGRPWTREAQPPAPPAPPAAPAASAARVGGGDHTHTCGRCGTVFDHSPAGDPSQSHRCPACGAGPWPVVTGFGPAAQAAARAAAPPPAYRLTPAAVLYGSDCPPGGG